MKYHQGEKPVTNHKNECDQKSKIIFSKVLILVYNLNSLKSQGDIRYFDEIDWPDNILCVNKSSE